jgi:hypothetical protein
VSASVEWTRIKHIKGGNIMSILNRFRGESKKKMEEDCEWVFNNVLSPYFKAAISHHDGINEPYTANFFCKRPFPTYGKTIEINGPPVSGYADTFYDMMVQSTSKDPHSPNIRILYRNKFVGILCPETQTLWAADWTHSKSFRITTHIIITHLKENGVLKPLT